jgi:hypothetical protein
MPDVRLHLTPTTLIRGAAAPAQSAQPDAPHDPDALFSIYDFLDLVARPPSRDQPPKRGSFSRDVWVRLTYTPPGQPKNALASLASRAPIRANDTRYRTTDMPVMPVAGLLELLRYVMREAKFRSTISDAHREYAMSVQRTLENFQQGDCSMLETLTEPAPHTARPHKKRKTAATATAATDVILRFSSDRFVFGTLHPVHEHVFSVYKFVDLIGRHLHPASNSVHFARRFWEYKISRDPYLRSVAVMAPIRCSANGFRNTITPALHAQGLVHLIRLMLNQPTEYKGKWKNKRYISVARQTVDPIGEILDAYIAGDRSMIEEIIEYNRH